MAKGLHWQGVPGKTNVFLSTIDEGLQPKKKNQVLMGSILVIYLFSLVRDI